MYANQRKIEQIRLNKEYYADDMCDEWMYNYTNDEYLQNMENIDIIEYFENMEE